MNGIWSRITPLVVVAALIAGGCGGGSAASRGASATSTAPLRSDVEVVQFRGDAARTGWMPGPGPTGAPTLRWRLELDGAVRTSVVVGFGLVFAASDFGTLYAADTMTGTVAWQRSLGGSPSTPAIADGKLVVGSSSGHVLALDPKTGATEWDTDLGSPIAGAPAVIDGGLVIAASDGRVVLLEPSAGRVVWSSRLDGRISRSPAVADGNVIVPLDPGRVAALDVRAGALRWSVRVATTGAVGSPSANAGIAFVAAGLGQGDEADRGVAALRSTTGEVLWRYASPTEKVLYTPAVHAGQVFIVGEDGRVAALDAISGRERWVDAGDEVLEALPSVVDDLVVVAGNGGHLRGLDVDDGQAAWSVPIEGVPYATTVTNGLVFVPSNARTVSAFGTPQ